MSAPFVARRHAPNAASCAAKPGSMRICPARIRSAYRPAVVVLLALLTLPACAQETTPSTSEPAPEAIASEAQTPQLLPFRTGAQALAARDFAALDGWRVGVVTNHTAVVDSAAGDAVHLIDRLDAAPNVTLAALFGPEHGLRGTAEAGAAVADGRDAATGVPVYSLYGSTKRPPAEALADLDALVFDIQDIGARFYTYISTMGASMQAAAEAGIPFVVLDRPNPLGRRADGFLRERAYDSFVGAFPIPVEHGLTVGELAAMIQGERWLPGLDGLDLRVVTMQGYAPTSSENDPVAVGWPAGLPFVPTSPNIPDLATAVVYPGTCLFEGTTASEGRGTDAPFLLVGAPWTDAAALADTLNARGLAGVRFEAATFVPEDLPGRAVNPKHEGQRVHGVRLIVTDGAAIRPVAVGVHVVEAIARQPTAPGPRSYFKRDWLAKLAGTAQLQRMLEAGAHPDAVVEAWAEDVAAFEALRAPYLRY
ncbi:MAG: DUF1343 domain-containing protein [Bacteroidota bacterium]